MNGISYFCGIAAAMYLATSLVVGAIRWFHMCKPFDKQPRYYYPGRPYVTMVFASALLLLPYVLDPESADAWYLVRMYFLPLTILHLSILQFAYFGSVMQWKRWRLPAILSTVPMALVMVAVEAIALTPGEQIGGVIPQALAVGTLHLTGALLTIVCGVSVAVVLKWAKHYDVDEFSNEEDFPVVFARKWMLLATVNAVIVWAAALVNSRVVMAVMMLLLSVSAVIFLITALHPNRNRPVEEEVAPKADGEPGMVYQRAISKKKRLEILQALNTAVVEQKAYLEPHLTIQDVADKCGYNRTYIAGILKGEFGGFFNYINSLRLKHVEDYMRQHPDATIQEAVSESGFASRQAYYTFKSRQD